MSVRNNSEDGFIKGKLMTKTTSGLSDLKSEREKGKPKERMLESLPCLKPYPSIYVKKPKNRKEVDNTEPTWVSKILEQELIEQVPDIPAYDVWKNSKYKEQSYIKSKTQNESKKLNDRMMKRETEAKEVLNKSNKNKPSGTTINPIIHNNNTDSEAHIEMRKVVKPSSSSMCDRRYKMVWAIHDNEDSQNQTNLKELKQNKNPGPRHILRYSIQ